MNIYEIAEIAGVSISTVSKVINGKRDIGKDTRLRILKIMEENNYAPNVSASVMDTIAVFAPINQETHLSNPYFSGVLAGIGEVAFNNNFGLTILSTEQTPKERLEFLSYCRKRRIVGGIFPLLTIDDRYLETFADKFPIVTLSTRFENDLIGCVMSDNFSGGYAAVKHLTKLHHERILFINPSTKLMDFSMRMSGGEKALEEAKLSRCSMDVSNSLSMNDTDLAERMKAIFESSQKPTAIFVASDQEALRVFRALQENGIHIPDEVSVVGFDNLGFAAYTNPPLTTVQQPIFEIGKEACKMLIGMLEKGVKSVNTYTMLNTELIVRMSTKDRKIVGVIKDIIEHEYARHIGLEEIANRVFLNSQYISRLFKHETGMNITDYLIEIRISHAKRLLRENPDIKVLDVAKLVGYADSVYFNKMFKKMVGITPARYRAKNEVYIRQ